MLENKKRSMELCERAADEQDPGKLAALILQINYILEAKELRLTGGVPAPAPVEDYIANEVPLKFFDQPLCFTLCCSACQKPRGLSQQQ